MLQPTIWWFFVGGSGGAAIVAEPGALIITLAGLDITSRVLIDSLSPEEGTGNTPGSCRFVMRADADFVPKAFQELVITHTLMTRRVFAGWTVDVNQLQLQAAHQFQLVEVYALDYVWQLNWLKLEFNFPYVNTTALFLVQRITNANPLVGNEFTSANASAELAAITVPYFLSNQGETRGEALARLMAMVKGQFYVDYTRDVHAFLLPEVSEISAPPLPIANAQTHFWDLQIGEDCSQFRTKADCLGQSTNTTADVAVGGAFIPVEDTAAFDSAGAVQSYARVGPNLISYTGRSVAAGAGNLTGVPTSGLYSIWTATKSGEQAQVIMSYLNATRPFLRAAALGYPRAVLRDDPSGYWRLEETTGTVIDDFGPNDLDGTISGAYVLNQAGALLDGSKGIVFDTSAGAITVSNVALDNLGRAPYTIEAWLKWPTEPPAAGAQTFVVGRGTTGGAERTVLMLQPAVDAAAFELNAIRNGNTVSTLVTYRMTGGAGTWKHCVCTYDGTTLRLYLNGTLVGSQASTQSVLVGTAPVTVAASYTGTSDQPSVTIDEVALYPRALSQALIISHYGEQAATVGSGGANDARYITQELVDDTFTGLQAYDAAKADQEDHDTFDYVVRYKTRDVNARPGRFIDVALSHPYTGRVYASTLQIQSCRLSGFALFSDALPVREIEARPNDKEFARVMLWPGPVHLGGH